MTVDDAAASVDRRYDGEVVLEFMEVGFGSGGQGEGVVEGVEEGGVVRAEGELGQGVGEVEGCRNSCQYISFVSMKVSEYAARETGRVGGVNGDSGYFGVCSTFNGVTAVFSKNLQTYLGGPNAPFPIPHTHGPSP